MRKPIFSIGHSNHTLDRFFDLLSLHEVEVVVDVRSKPYSRYTTHFHGPIIQKELQKAGFKYLFLGKELGGMPDNRGFYDEDGNVVYERIAQTPAFTEAFERLQNGMTTFRIALMCGEENPSGCHRRNLLGKKLADGGVVLQHIRGDGRLEIEADFSKTQPEAIQQLDLFQELM